MSPIGTHITLSKNVVRFGGANWKLSVELAPKFWVKRLLVGEVSLLVSDVVNFGISWLGWVGFCAEFAVVAEVGRFFW